MIPVNGAGITESRRIVHSQYRTGRPVKKRKKRDTLPSWPILVDVGTYVLTILCRGAYVHVVPTVVYRRLKKRASVILANLELLFAAFADFLSCKKGSALHYVRPPGNLLFP